MAHMRLTANDCGLKHNQLILHSAILCVLCASVISVLKTGAPYIDMRAALNFSAHVSLDGGPRVVVDEPRRQDRSVPGALTESHLTSCQIVFGDLPALHHKSDAF